MKLIVIVGKCYRIELETSTQNVVKKLRRIADFLAEYEFLTDAPPEEKREHQKGK